ncbi:hypothetical protein ANCCAN_30128 [Ancylostoma caninum]|uniref:Uncharacterized protein n=1 Tax=Ancylostoma caninum TaxID=29170 RepID=A0A368EWP6_ANCCA|nr:hypothetical protein ANCCAN_30128 [Ancylostoma caninum]
MESTLIKGSVFYQVSLPLTLHRKNIDIQVQRQKLAMARILS